MPFIILALMVTGFISPARAALVPDHTYELEQTLVGADYEVKLWEMFPSQSRGQIALTGNIGTEPLAGYALIGAGTGNPILVGFTEKGHDTVIIYPNKAQSVWKPQLKIRAVGEFSKTEVIAAGENNEILAIDQVGGERELINKYMFNPTNTGPILRIQMVDADHFVVLTRAGFLSKVTLNGGGTPFVVHGVDMTGQTFGSNSFYRTVDMAAGPDTAWIEVLVSPHGNAANVSRELMLFDYMKGYNTVSVPIPVTAKLQLLDLDPSNEELFVKEGNDYVRYEKSGTRTEEHKMVFNTRTGLAVPTVIDHPRAVLASLLPRSATPVVAAPQPVVPPPPPSPPPPPPAPTPVPKKVEPSPPPEPKKVLPKFVTDPVTPQEFSELIAREMPKLPASPASTTIEEFVAVVNQTNNLRFYFQNLEAEELAIHGLQRQMYWVRVMPGSEKSTISMQTIARMLSVGREREIRVKKCEADLTKKKP